MTLGVLGTFEPESISGQITRTLIRLLEIEPIFASVPGPEVPGQVAMWSKQGVPGCLVLPPLRADAARVAERFFSARHSLGVANALRFTNAGVFGFNSEVDGFLSALSDVEPGTALVLGAGATARTACLGLLANGWTVKLWNRTFAKSRVFSTALASYGQVQFIHEADPSGCRLVVNATPLGMRAGEQPPVAWSMAAPKTIAHDFVLRQVQTEFLRSAAARGFRCISGKECFGETLALAIEAALDISVGRGLVQQALTA